MLRLLRLLLVVLLVAPLGGCGPVEEVHELATWTLIAPSGARREVTVPVQFEAADLDPRSHVVLERTAPLPDAWRGGPMTLAVPAFQGGVALSVNGAPVPAQMLGIAHWWSIGAAAGDASALRLRLELDAGSAPVLVHVPRLSPTPDGDAMFRRVRAYNFLSSVAALSLCAFLIVLYGTVFLIDRGRRAHGWFVLQVAWVLPAVAVSSGLPLAYMPWTGVVDSYTTLVAVFAAEGFFRAYFQRPPLHRGWFVALGLLPFALAVPRTGAGRVIAEQIVLSLVLLGILRQLRANVREARSGRDRFPAVMLAAAWLILMIATFPDIAVTTGLGVVASGVQGTGIGIVMYAVFQTLVLGRDHVRSLRAAEARVLELEAHGREVDLLNEELRHQVAERSRALTEVLVRSDGLVAPAALNPGDVFDGRYVVRRALGRGGMGAVYEVDRQRDGKRLALKVLTAVLSARLAARFAREAEIGARLRHEHLVSIVDVGISATATPYLVMELVRGGSMEDWRRRFGDVPWALPLVRQIAVGLAELHAHRIVHRDLKPGNVLLAYRREGGPVAKISDFGVSRFGAWEHDADVDAEGQTVAEPPKDASPGALTQTGALLGTTLYMPPEAAFGPARHASADVFALGVLAYEALTGRYPFPEPAVQLVRMGRTVPTPELVDGVGEKVAEIVLACLRVEPFDRPSASEVARALAADGATAIW